MHGERAKRVGQLLKEEVSRLILREIKDPHLGFVTITRVKVSPDLQNATIYVSVLGGESERTKSLKILTQATGFFKRHIGKNLHLKHIPHITFLFDPAIEYSLRLEEIFRELREKEN
jgi:ribosome-binding factor A